MSLSITAELRKNIEQAVNNLWPELSVPHFDISVPTIGEHGDLASNCALILSKLIKKSPMDIAQAIVSELRSHAALVDVIREFAIAAPGFINVRLNHEKLLKHFDAYWKKVSTVSPRREKIVIEHTNVNPNKAMHIGHLRNAILGDTIKRVLDRAGFTTEVQYYVDDTGVQVADTFLGLRKLGLKQDVDEKYDHYCWRVYTAINQAYELNPEMIQERTALLHALEERSSAEAHDVKEFTTKIVHDHLLTMSHFGIAYDVLVWESDIFGFGFWQKAFEQLQKSDVFVKETQGKNAGCWVIKNDEDAADEAFSMDKIIIKSDGTVTYTGKDIAYHLWKYDLLGIDFLYADWPDAPQDRPLATTDQSGSTSQKYGKADRVYNVIDVRQSYPQAMIKVAFDALGFHSQSEKLRHVAYGVVSLSAATAEKLGMHVDTGKTVYSMSGRKGIGVKVDDLLASVTQAVKERTYDVASSRPEERIASADVAVGAIKYFMLRYNPQTDIIFDFDEAMSLTGNTGPYIQYAHARASAILEKAGGKDVPMPKKMDELTTEEQKLISLVYQWPVILERVADDLNVNLITNYAFDLANAFNTFYEACPVVKAEGVVRQQRIHIVAMVKEVLHDVLSVLGIVAPTQM